MKSATIVLVSLLVALSHGALQSIQEVQGSISGYQADDTHLRAYEIAYYPDANPRVVALEGVSAERTTSTANIDAVMFVLNTINDCSLAFSYFHAIGQIPANGGNLTDVTGAGFVLLLKNFAVFEFVNRDGVPGYQNTTGLNADIITGGYDLSSDQLQWKPMQSNKTTITDSNGNVIDVSFIQIETLDEVFTLRFTISGSPIEVNGVKLTPDTIKVDYQIKWFTDLHVPAAWTTGPSNSTLFPTAQVGVLAALATEAGVFVQNTSRLNNNPSLSVQAGAFEGFFAFETAANVTVQGVVAEQAVVGSVHDQADPSVTDSFAAGWSVKVVFFSFAGNRPEEVVWDPEMGANIDYSKVDSGNGSSSSNPASTLSVSLTVLFLAVAASLANL